MVLEVLENLEQPATYRYATRRTLHTSNFSWLSLLQNVCDHVRCEDRGALTAWMFRSATRVPWCIRTIPHQRIRQHSPNVLFEKVSRRLLGFRDFLLERIEVAKPEGLFAYLWKLQALKRLCNSESI